MAKAAERSVSIYSTVVATEDNVCSNLGGEAVILGITSGVYYGLDVVGARIWDLIQVKRNVAEIRDLLLDEYEVEQERCERDLIALLGELAANGLISINNVAHA